MAIEFRELIEYERKQRAWKNSFIVLRADFTICETKIHRLKLQLVHEND